MYQAPRGTQDVLPGDIAYHTFVETTARRFAALYGYQELRSPTFEETGLFRRGAGEATDVVEKEMYSFRDKGDNDITLRAEGTAPIMRAYLQHGMHTLPQPVRLFSLISVFRYDRPQAGRLREHHQLDCEAIGEDDPLLDGELIALLWRFYEALGLRDLSLQINSIGDAKCRPAYLELLGAYYRGHEAELCGDCRRRLELNPLRLLDCKVPTCQPIAEHAPSLIDHLCDACTEHYQRVLAVVAEEKIPVVANPRLVRGFDYYTRTVFEVWPRRTGEQSALGGGGRYDGLAEQLGGKHTPGVGFGTGIERLILNLKDQAVEVSSALSPQVYVVHLGTGTEPAADGFARELRGQGVRTLRGVGSRSMRARLRHADAAGVRWVAVFGEDEVKDSNVSLRDMAATQPEPLSTREAIQRIVSEGQEPRLAHLSGVAGENS